MKRKVLVTGAAGFIGSNLCLELERQGYTVVAMDDFSNGKLLNLSGFKGEFIPRDFSKMTTDDWFRLKEVVDTVYHMGAVTDTRETDDMKIITVNYEAFKKIVDFCTWNNKRLIYASSAAVYGAGKAPNKETDKTKPLNGYGVSKLMMENYVLNLKSYLQPNAVGLRFFNVFGPNELHKQDFASMPTQMLMNIIHETPVKLFKYGEQKRDQVYVKDVVSACISSANSAVTGVYNIGSGAAVSFNEILDLINLSLNKTVKAIYIDNPWPFYQEHTLADITKARKDFGYNPRPFKSTFSEYISTVVGRQNNETNSKS